MKQNKKKNKKIILYIFYKNDSQRCPKGEIKIKIFRISQEETRRNQSIGMNYLLLFPLKSPLNFQIKKL